MNRILLVTPNLEEVGGVQALLRALNRALDDRPGLDVEIVEMGSQKTRFRRLRFSASVLRAAAKPAAFIWFGHLNFAPLAWAARVGHRRSVIGLLVYGREIEPPLGRKTRTQLGRFDRVLAISEHTASFAIDGGVRPERLSVLPLGLTDNHESRDPSPRRLISPLRVLVVSRLDKESKRKNVDVVIASLADRRLAGGVVQLDIIGGGSDLGRLVSLARSSGVAAQVHFHGEVSEAVKQSMYGESHVLAFMSEQEGFGLVVVEAWRAGLAVVCTSSGALSELCTDGDNALLCQPEAAAVADALWLLVQDEGLRLALAGSGQELALGFYSFPVFADRATEALTRELRDKATTDVLRLIPSFTSEYGGPAVALAAVTSQLQSKGVSTTVVSLDLPTEKLLATSGAVRRIAVGPGFTRWGLSRRTRRVLRDIDAAVIVVHGVWNHQLGVARRHSRRTGTPFVVYSHGMLDAYFLQRMSLSSLLKRLLYLVSIRRSLTAAAAVLMTSDQERDRIAPFFQRGGWRPIVVKYGVQSIPEVAGSVDISGFPVGGYVLFLSRVHPKKRPDLLIAALADPRLQDVNVVIAGTGEQRYLATLRKYAVELGVASRVIWFGHASGEAKASLLSGALALCLPSEQENFGVVVAEAMSAACPVVVSTEVALRTLVETSQCGTVIQELTPEGVANALAELLLLDRKTLGLSARTAYCEHCSVQAATESFLEIVHPLIEEARTTESER